MSNCIKSRYDKCPLKDNCYGLVNDSEDCKCRLEDYHQGRADLLMPYDVESIEELIENIQNKATADAIDEFVEFANTMPTVESEDGEIRPMWLEEMAKQLKGDK